MNLDLGGLGLLWGDDRICAELSKDCARILTGSCYLMLDIGCARLRDDGLRKGVGRSLEGF